MTTEILFISDIHLARHKPLITQRFIHFLRHRAVQAQALYILGDLFDAWVGDDDDTAFAQLIRRELKQLSTQGTQLYLQQGNRDFFLAESFCQRTGAILLNDYTVIDLFATKTLLMHGDLLCSDDTAYQTFRLKAHSLDWQTAVLAKPLWLRLLVARWYRWRSFWHKRGKSLDIMDVNQTTVLETLKKYQCYRLIHGHTHRPAVHDLFVNERPAQRFVLTAWHNESAEVLSWNEQGYKIERI